MKTTVWKPTRLALALATALALPIHSSRAGEDIDLYVTSPLQTGDLPNVLFLWDNSANWAATFSTGGGGGGKGGGGATTTTTNCYYVQIDANGNALLNPDKTLKLSTTGPVDQGTKLGVEQCALYNTVAALPTTADGKAMFNVGLMLMNEASDPVPAGSSGYPRSRFLPMDSANKITFLNKIKALGKNSDKASGTFFSSLMHEAYLYFKGMTPISGDDSPKHDTLAFSGGKYISPSATGCNRNYIIMMTNGSPSSSENGSCPTTLASIGGSMTPALSQSPVDLKSCADEYARHLYRTDFSSKDDTQNIITHAVAVVVPSDGDGFVKLSESIAYQGGGQFYKATDATTLTTQLLEIFNSIQAVNSVFSSASLPVSVTGQSQGYFLNQVFMGMFRPDGEAKPRWRGNLKQYKFSYDLPTDKLELVDANGKSAIDSTTGFITPSAASFWTTSSVGSGTLSKGYWVNDPLYVETPDDLPDGDSVEKGGVAEVIRKANLLSTTTPFASTRKIWTTNGSNSFVEFNAANSSLDSTLVDWVRGKDNIGTSAAGDPLDKGPDPARTEVNVRPSVHGDALHSRPAVIAYTDNDVAVFYGTNDGMLRAVNGSQGSGGGAEYWAFIPEEHKTKLARLKDNAPEVRYSTTPSTNTTAQPRDYFVDGNIVAYQTADGASKYLYVPMRRGGRFLYALDVTNKTSPSIMWKVNATNTNNPTTVVSKLGQTWSTPKIATVKGYANPVLIMGGGYDATAEDADTPTSPTMGNIVVMLDAKTGQHLLTLDTDYPVTGEVFMVPNSDGTLGRVYAVDVGGKIYRITLPTTGGVSGTTIKKIADLDQGRSSKRKFMYGPSVAAATDNDGKRFFAVMAGTGDREKPLLKSSNDFFYLVKDYEEKDDVIVHGDLKDIEDVKPEDVFDSGFKGCRLALSTAGEKVVTSVVSAYGESYFSTNKPQDQTNPNSCVGNLGQAKSYTVPLYCQAATATEFIGGGLPPTPVAGYVAIDMPDGSKQIIPMTIGAVPTGSSGGIASSIAGQNKQKINLKDGKRLYWKIKRD